MKYTWNIHEIYVMKYTCEMFMTTWNIHEIYMDYTWNIHDVYTCIYDKIYMYDEMYMKYTCMTKCTCTYMEEEICIKCTWNIHEIYTSLMYTCTCISRLSLHYNSVIFKEEWAASGVTRTCNILYTTGRRSTTCTVTCMCICAYFIPPSCAIWSPLYTWMYKYTNWVHVPVYLQVLHL